MQLATQTALPPAEAKHAPPRLVTVPADAPVVAHLLCAGDALASLAGEWTALAEMAADPNSFAEYWFVAASLGTLGRGRDVRILAVRRGADLIGILPLSRERSYGRLSVDFVQNWCHHHNFLGTPLVRRGDEAAFWAAALDALDRDRRQGNFLHIRGLGEDGAVHRGLIEATRASGRSCATVHRESRALLESDLDPKAYYETRTRPKKRKEIRRLQARLSEIGPVQARHFRSGDDLDAWCATFMDLERAGWKGAGGTALACSADTKAFFRAAVHGAHVAGQLDFLRLDVGDRTIAMLVNFIAAPGSFSFKTAFDEEYSRFSPGVLIQIENLNLLDRRDIGWMDSCAVENHPMIDSLWSERRQVVRVTIPLRGARRRIVHAACRMIESGSAMVRHFAGRR